MKPTNHGSFELGSCISLWTMNAILTLKYVQDASTSGKCMTVQQIVVEESCRLTRHAELALFAFPDV